MEISKIYYINADAAPVRREWMESHLSQQDIPYERFSAIMATRDEHVDDDMKRRIRAGFPDIQVGAIGCYLSHLNIIEQLIENQPESHVLMLEDDVELLPDWQERLNSFEARGKFGDDWDMIRSCWKSPVKNVHKFKFCSHMSKHYVPERDDNVNWNGGGTHFQIINKNSMQRVYDFLTQENMFGIDWMYTTTALNVYHTKLARINDDVGFVEHFRHERKQRAD